jgi:SAM-dependent methyltransferase
LGIDIIGWSDIPQERFDFINAEQVFEHISDPVPTLKHLVSALKPKGIVRINVPNGWDIERRLAKCDWDAPKGSRDSLNAIAPLEHINCFNKKALVVLAARAGLTLVSITPKIRMGPSLLQFTVRDLLRPGYDTFRRFRSRGRGGSTRLSFQLCARI